MEYVFKPDIDVVVVDALYKTLSHRLLNGEDVLWIISGGSAISTAVAVAEKLKGRRLTTLSVTLADERYGPIGHADENWQALLDAGFTLRGATLYRPLIDKDRTETTAKFNLWLKDHFSSADYTIGLFGVGADGHTAGIKPGSPVVTATEWATDYTGPDFERITITPSAIAQLAEAIIQVKGTEKADTVRQLRDETVSDDIQPAQVLKRAKKSTLYTNIREVS